MKKIFSLLALMLAAMMLLAACGGTATTGTTAGTQGTTAGGTTAGTTAGTQGTTAGTQGTTGGTVTPGDTPDYSKSIKILAVGNSFSVDAMEHLAVILKAAGVEEIVLGNLYIGGCSLDTHMKNINAGSTSYEYFKNTGDGWTSTKNESIDTGLMDEEWDIVTIQQVSQDSGKPETFTYLTQIVEYIKNTVLNEDVKVYWHMTWAYQGGYNDTNKFGAYNNDQMTMYKAITDATQNTVLKNSLIDGFIPSGTAIQNLRTSYFGDALTRDGFHLSYDIGRYTAALMWYKQITGGSIKDLAAAPSAYPGIIEHLPAIKEAVEAAYAKPFEVTKSTKTEYVNELTVMTDADKAHLKGLGLDPAKYEVLDLKLLFSAYYNSTSSSNYAKPVNNAANSPQYLATGIFTPQTLPVGSVVKIADGFQYRLEGWQQLNTKNNQTRRDNSTENITITEDLYKVYNFIAFNVSHLPVNEVVADVVYDDRTALRIYVPIAAEESTEMTADDKAYLTALGLNPDNYVKVKLDYTLFAYYNCSSNIYSAPNGRVDNNLVNFISTRPIAKAEIPNGSIIRVDKGFQYRPEGWPDLGVAISGSSRPGNVTGDETYNYVFVDDAWWKDYTYRGFNVAVKGNGAVVSMETGTHFAIYALKEGATAATPTKPAETLPTTVEGWFEYYKLDMNDYQLLEFTPVLHAYYYSNSGENYGSSLVKGASNSTNYWATEEYFTKETLPAGSLIFIEKGYQFRPEGWQDLSTNNTASRPGNINDYCTMVTEDWWKDYTYRSFNISKVQAAVMTSETFGVLKIYVPKPVMTDAELFASKGLDINNYEKVTLTTKLKTFYNSTGGSGTTVSTKDGDTGSKFWCTQIFAKADLPTGTVITVADGYRYRPEAWTDLSSKNASADRPAETSERIVVVDDAWWGSFNHRAFNVSTDNAAIADRAVVTEADLVAFTIYVPKAN